MLISLEVGVAGAVIKEVYLGKKAPEMIPEGWLDFYSWQ